MKRKYEDVAFDRIAKLKKEIDSYRIRLGEKRLFEILVDRFGVSDKDARHFLRIMEEMIPGVPFDAIPQEWFFDPGRNSYQSLRSMRDEIREERKDIIYTINSFWKLSKELQSNNIELWPEEWHKHLMKEKIIIDDEEEVNSAEVVYSAPEIADLILSKRYETTPSTIYSYAKAEKFD